MEQIPSDYYRRLREVEGSHWWHRGMLALSTALLGDRLDGGGLSVLDAGCGTGGFLAWCESLGAFARLCGVDFSDEAIELASESVARAELHVAPVSRVPFAAASFDLVSVNDVLQHIREDEVSDSLRELHRVLRPSGALLVRTNGARRARSERSDWRAYDAETLGATLTASGFGVQRLTYANMLLSFAAAARGRTPHAPTESGSGIPPQPGVIAQTVGGFLLGAEARYLGRPGRRLPYGHTLFAVAVPSAEAPR